MVFIFFGIFYDSQIDDDDDGGRVSESVYVIVQRPCVEPVLMYDLVVSA